MSRKCQVNFTNNYQEQPSLARERLNQVEIDARWMWWHSSCHVMSASRGKGMLTSGNKSCFRMSWGSLVLTWKPIQIREDQRNDLKSSSGLKKGIMTQRICSQFIHFHVSTVITFFIVEQTNKASEVVATMTRKLMQKCGKEFHHVAKIILFGSCKCYHILNVHSDLAGFLHKSW